MIDKKQNIVDFYSNTSDSRTWSFTIQNGDDETDRLQFAWTGSGGAQAYWDAWRAANSDADGTSGNFCQDEWYAQWVAFSDGVMYQDTNSKSIGEIVAIQQADITAFNERLVKAQAEIDAGNGDVEEPTE